MNTMTKHAFAIGALEKLKEAGVDAGAFVRAAANSGDQDAIKIASAMLELSQAFEKNANIFGRMAGGLADSFKSVGRAGSDLLGAGRNYMDGRAFRQAGQTAKAEGAGKATTKMLGQDAAQHFGKARQQLGQAGQNAMKATPAVAATGLGAGGLAYGMGDADTWENKAVNASNRYLGTDFETQSRLGSLFS